MERFYEKFDKWEDYKNGMYNTDKLENEDELINKAINLLSDVYQFNATCKL